MHHDAGANAAKGSSL